MSKQPDEFGDRMKEYEAVETKRRLDVHLPIYARIDGRAFSSFTRGMRRPFDVEMTSAMIETTSYLVEETHAKIGYTQSDEINLIYLADNPESDIFFSGKVLKMASILASMTAAKFATVCPLDHRHKLPHFDARVFQLPSKTEAANCLLWRAMDARKNAIQSAAQSYFSSKGLHGKSQGDMLLMLESVGIDFDGYYPTEFRRGTFIQRKTKSRLLTYAELSIIPVDKRPNGPVLRTSVEQLDIPPLYLVKDREAVIFG